MMRAYKFRLYPNNSQKTIINKAFGCTRFVYNYYLSKRKENSKLSCYECMNDLSILNKEHPWLKEVDSMSLRCALFNLDDAFGKMYKSNFGYPRFKSKFNDRKSYRTNYVKNNIRINLNDMTIRLPKLKDVKIRGYRNLKEINGRIINTTISKESNGKYYVSIVIEKKDISNEININKIIGLDLGIKDIVITSNGEKYKNEKVIDKYEKRITKIQRQLSKKVKESNNYYKTKKKLSTIYSKLKNARKYLIHQITNKIVKESDVIVTEKLQIQNMTKNHKLAKSIIDVTWYEIIRQLGYKSKWHNKKLYQIDTFYPSSQECSVCGNINTNIKVIGVREWICEKCNSSHDRDINASINIMFEGLKKYMREVFA